MNLFFPSHDIALGNGVKHFNPPAAALRLQEDLAWLEEIFSPKDKVSNPPSSLFPIHSSLFTLPSPIPWGWSWDMREYLHKEYHISRKDLPTDEHLEALRQLSNRRTTIEILKSLNFGGQMPEYLQNEDQIDTFINKVKEDGAEYVLKTPWSSSGRGLIRSSVTPIEILKRRALSTIQKMGGIMGERWFDKKQDFAMLFFVGHEKVHFLGYSLFDNEESGTYRQGYLLSNEEIERRLTADGEVSIEQLHQVSNQLIDTLSSLFSPFFGLPWQVGYIGIDMMTVDNPNLNPNINPNLLRANSSRDTSKASLSNPNHNINHNANLNHNANHNRNLKESIPPSSLFPLPSSLTPHSSFVIHPCVELNLRCTMGVVCRLWSDRNLKPGQQGRFVISPMGDDGHFNAQFITD